MSYIKKREGEKRDMNPKRPPRGRNNKEKKTDDAAYTDAHSGTHTDFHAHPKSPFRRVSYVLLSPSVHMIHNA